MFDADSRLCLLIKHNWQQAVTASHLKLRNARLVQGLSHCSLTLGRQLAVQL